jgi:hypothetical protein
MDGRPPTVPLLRAGSGADDTVMLSIQRVCPAGLLRSVRPVAHRAAGTVRPSAHPVLRPTRGPGMSLPWRLRPFVNDQIQPTEESKP